MSAGPFLHRLQQELGGAIPFERYMAEALYNADFGYYASRIRTVGRRGDFSTMATLDTSLARAMAKWIHNSRARHIIEVGGGSGQLARDTLRALGWWARRHITLHIVEISRPLRDAQQKLLRGFRVAWHETVPSALEAASGEAHIFSNELPDAFPCRIFELSAQGWMELHVRIQAGAIHEILQPCDPPDSTALAYPFPIGQRVEVHQSYRHWLNHWAPAWKSGAMLTIDYGDTMPAIYQRRPAGTIRGYACHQLLTGPEILQSPGRIDLTADVNFTDLEKWGTELGWHTTEHTSLADFLPQPLPHQFLGAAQSFRVLEQTAPPAK
jgi:SAM-dependent MidA family methyltransferase